MKVMRGTMCYLLAPLVPFKFSDDYSMEENVENINNNFDIT